MKTLTIKKSDADDMMEVLTPLRISILRTLQREGMMSINQLSKEEGRNYKNIHGDVAVLMKHGLVVHHEPNRRGSPVKAVYDEINVTIGLN